MWLLGGRDIQPTDAAAPALRIARMAVTVEIICVMVGIWQTVWAASAKRSKPERGRLRAQLPREYTPVAPFALLVASCRSRMEAWRVDKPRG